MERIRRRLDKQPAVRKLGCSMEGINVETLSKEREQRRYSATPLVASAGEPPPCPKPRRKHGVAMRLSSVDRRYFG